MKQEYDTLKYYNENSENYFEQTKNADLSTCYNEFLKELPEKSYILDFGCGSGRDSKYFLEHGYKVKAIDGSSGMCDIATKYIGQKVECLKFSELSDINEYDGIWACSSILHVEKQELPEIITKMIKSLKQNGVIYTSFKKGNTFEVKDGKYFNYTTKEDIEKILEKVNLDAKIINYFETGSSTKRPGDNEVVWCNYIIKKY